MPKPQPPGFIDTKKLSMILEEAWVKSMKERKILKTWNNKFTKPVTKQFRVSLVTTCMNRLDNLKQTMPLNIKDNINYSNIEFVLLDYNSKDGLEDWVKNNLMEYIERGVLNYYRTTEPKYFSMAHSRNIAFLASSGLESETVINNIDADAFAKKGFAEFINKIANEFPEKVIFAKSRQLLRGRMGLFKKDFKEMGGYNEEPGFDFYGHDDADLLNRCVEKFFTFAAYSRHGDFVGTIKDHIKHQEDGNYPVKWWVSEGRNRLISYTNLIVGNFVANQRRVWGKATLIKNFQEEVETGVQG